MMAILDQNMKWKLFQVVLMNFIEIKVVCKTVLPTRSEKIDVQKDAKIQYYRGIENCRVTLIRYQLFDVTVSIHSTNNSEETKL
jgi:hypothetical protein